MSGGVEEMFHLNTILEANKKSELDSFWRILKQARSKKSVICCNLEADDEIVDLKLENGLVKGHAYVVTTLVSINLKAKNTQYRLLKCHK